jgi:beta-glucanase (GH16 family)
VNLVDGTGNDGAEIDVFESAFVEDKTASTIHIDGYGNDHQENSKRYPAAGLHGSFHVWGMLWDENQIKIYYDGELKAEFSKEGGEEKWISRTKEYVQLSTGASWANEGDFKSASVDSHLTNAYVDYIRIWTFDTK